MALWALRFSRVQLRELTQGFDGVQGQQPSTTNYHIVCVEQDMVHLDLLHT